MTRTAPPESGEAIQFLVSRRDGPESVRTFEARQLVVGRQRRADIRITGGPLSRRHLLFVHEGHGWTVRCGGRIAATRRNGKPFPNEATDGVKDGDVFEMQAWRVEVVFTGRARFAAWLAAAGREGGRRVPLLRVDRTQGASEWIEAVAPRTVIGRSARADIVVPGFNVSRTHVVLERNGRDWTATHQGRLLGTTLRGESLVAGAARVLASGDAILVADSRTVVCLDGRPPELRWDDPFPEDTLFASPSHPGAETADVDARDVGRAALTIERTKLDTRRAAPSRAAEPIERTRELWDDDSSGADGRAAPGTVEPTLLDRTQPSAAAAGTSPGETQRDSEPDSWPQTRLADGSDARWTLRDGFVIGGRFRVERRRPSDRPAAAWTGTDQRTGSAVWVYDAFVDEGRDGDPRARFAADLRRAAELRHAGLEQIVLVEELGRRFLVITEPPPLSRLADEIARRSRDGASFPPDEIVRIADATAAALEFAGDDLFHGALDPEFVGLLPRGGVRIAAVGWREILAAPGSGRLPEYSAPETRGARGDARADQYSLGAIVRELAATGSNSAVATEAWSRFVDRATAPRPENRFRNWSEFRAALQRIAD